MKASVYLVLLAEAALIASVLNANDFELLLIILFSQSLLFGAAAMFGFKTAVRETEDLFNRKGLLLAGLVILLIVPVAGLMTAPNQHSPWKDAPLEQAQAAPDLFLLAGAAVLTLAGLFRALMSEEL